MSLNFLNLCHGETCGKCVPMPHRSLWPAELDAASCAEKGKWKTSKSWSAPRRSWRARPPVPSAAPTQRLVLSGLKGFRDDYIEHIQNHRCLGNMEQRKPCAVALCPASVDILGYIALIREGRCADAVRLIRKDNPFPVACAYVSEHPCEARCRRTMLDEPINIRGSQADRRRYCRRCAALMRANHRQKVAVVIGVRSLRTFAPIIWH